MDWGPLTREDARGMAELLAAIAAEDRSGDHYSVENTAEYLSHPLIDLAEGTLAAREGDRIAAFGYLPVPPSTLGGVHVMSLTGGVHPAHRRRGVGRRIVDWAVSTAPGLSEKVFPGAMVELHMGGYDTNEGFKALAEESGFAAVRYFARMERSLSGDLPAAGVPRGVRVATWSPELDEGARHVRNESFRDHWGSVPHSRESWTSTTSGSSNFRPESSFVALAGDQAVGVLITHFFEARSAHRGDRQAMIQIIGTLKEWRGKGVASALIAHALAAFARQGYQSVALGVDAHNPTGAVSVYERAGFEITKRSTTYSLTLAQGEAGDEAGAGVHE